MPSFVGGKSRGAFGQPRFSWREIAWPSSLLSSFSKTIVRRYCSIKLEKKTFNTYKWKEKVQKNTGSRRKLQVTKATFKGPHRFVFFTAESLPCSETQPSKWSLRCTILSIYYGQRNYILKLKFNLCHKKCVIYFWLQNIITKRAQICERCSLKIFCHAGSVTRIAFKLKYKLTGFRINFFKNDFSVYYFVCLFITVGQSTVARQLHKHHLRRIIAFNFNCRIGLCNCRFSCHHFKTSSVLVSTHIISLNVLRSSRRSWI